MIKWVECEKCGITEDSSTLSDGVCTECMRVQGKDSPLVANKVTPLTKLSIALDKISDKFENIFEFGFSDRLANVTGLVFWFCVFAFFVKVVILTFNSTEERYSLILHYLPAAEQIETTKYRVVNGQLISSKDGHLRNLSEDRECVVMNRRNWHCTWQSSVMSNQSNTGAIFENAVFEDRMVKGHYSIFSDAWTPRLISKVNELTDVSLLRYSWNGCKQEFKHNFLSGLINCPLFLAFYYP